MPLPCGSNSGAEASLYASYEPPFESLPTTWPSIVHAHVPSSAPGSNLKGKSPCTWPVLMACVPCADHVARRGGLSLLSEFPATLVSNDPAVMSQNPVGRSGGMPQLQPFSLLVDLFVRGAIGERTVPIVFLLVSVPAR